MSGQEIIVALQNQLGNLISPITSVAGTVITLIFLRKKTSVEISTQEFEKIKAGKLGEVADELLKNGQLTYTEYYKMGNFLEIAKRADKVNSNKSPLENVPQQDLDWHIRFFDDCGYVSNEYMQEIWARLLAGEVRNPGSYSLRTIQCLKNMSQKEALLFKKICDCSYDSVRHVILPNNDSFLDKKGIKYEDILTLGECGLVNSDPNITETIKMNVGKEYSIIGIRKDQVLVVKTKANDGRIKNDLTIPEYLFTQIGKEIYTVVTAEGLNLTELLALYSNNYKDYEFFITNVVRRDGERVIYRNPHSAIDQRSDI